MITAPPPTIFCAYNASQLRNEPSARELAQVGFAGGKHLRQLGRVLVIHVQIHGPALAENLRNVIRSGFADDEILTHL